MSRRVGGEIVEELSHMGAKLAKPNQKLRSLGMSKI